VPGIPYSYGRNGLPSRRLSSPTVLIGRTIQPGILSLKMTLTFTGPIWYWRGPSPFHFVTIPEQESEELKDISGLVTYGWGMVPATITIGATTYKTSLWPKNGGYIVPLKDVVRKAERLELDDTVTVHLEVEVTLS
jgi:Domain of unknown function (DUF1905)